MSNRDEFDRTDFQDAFDAGKGHAQLAVDGDSPDFLVVTTAPVNVATIEKYYERPSGKRGTIDVFTPDSFVAYVKAHHDNGTAIFADIDARTVVAVLDHHHPGATLEDGAGWGRHRCALTLRPTVDWQLWKKANGAQLPQLAFAEFIESQIHTIAEPNGAALLEMVQTFDAKRSVTFASVVNLHDGTREFTFNETTTPGDSTTGKVKVPSTLTLSLQPFEGSDKYKVTARLRYRISGGGLALWVDLLRPDLVVDDAYNKAVEKVETELGGALFRGKAPAVLAPL